MLSTPSFNLQFGALNNAVCLEQEEGRARQREYLSRGVGKREGETRREKGLELELRRGKPPAQCVLPKVIPGVIGCAMWQP